MANEFLSSITIQNGLVTAGTFSAITTADLPPSMGSVTSVDVSGGSTGLTTSGGPITSSGTITIAGTVNVAHGGTGDTSLTAYAVLCGGTTSTNPVQSIASVGTAGQVLTSNGAGALPTFQAAGGGSSPPFSDASPLVMNNADNTKEIIFSAAGITTGTIRTYTGPDYNGTLAVINHAQTFTALNTFGPNRITSPFGSGTGDEAFGASAGASGASGNNSTLLGNAAGTALTTGGDNTGVGYHALTSATTGNTNTAVGSGAGAVITTANNCVAIGYQTLGAGAGVTGNGNIGIGYQTLNAITSGVSNVAIGTQAGFPLSTGSSNILIGRNAGGNLANVSNCVLIGETAGNNISNNSNTGVGFEALKNQTSAQYSVAVGTDALVSLGTGDGNVMVGAASAGSMTLATGAANVLLGRDTDTSAAGTSNGIAIGQSAICDSNQFIVGAGAHPINTTRIKSGTGATARFEIWGYSSTNTERAMIDMNTLWVDSTDATRKARGFLHAYDTAAREVMRWEADGSNPKLGYFGTSSVVQQSGTGETVGFTAGTGTTVHDDSTFTGNVGATAYRISDIVKALKNYGLLAS